jgi:hypothetical protein
MAGELVREPFSQYFTSANCPPSRAFPLFLGADSSRGSGLGDCCNATRPRVDRRLDAP